MAEPDNSLLAGTSAISAFSSVIFMVCPRQNGGMRDARSVERKGVGDDHSLNSARRSLTSSRSNAAGSKGQPIPTAHFVVLFMFRVFDGFEEFEVAGSASDMLGRAGALAADARARGSSPA